MPWIALIGPELEENLSLRYLAASLQQAGWQCEIFPYNGEIDFQPVLSSILATPEPPLLVAISLAFQWRAAECIALGLALKRRGFTGHLTAGGHFGTFVASELLDDFPELDSVCLYEAEGTLVELAKALHLGQSLDNIGGLARRDSEGRPKQTPLRLTTNLDTLPWPDRRGTPQHCLGHNIATLVGSRGCYGDCAFCCIAAWHKQAKPQKRFRLRSVNDLADEMAWLNREHHIDIFIFHDDNFFIPGHQHCLERINQLADALNERNMGPFATVVKARPNDVTPEVFRAMKERLGCLRLFLGVETHAHQGLATLRRRVRQEQNAAAIAQLEQLELYFCFNMLIFDPDTDWRSLEMNLSFMEEHSAHPFNFGRVELYAGTPLLARMQKEQRCVGDYMGWDYKLATPEMQRVFEIGMKCFYPRNFAAGALANRLMGTRFDVEVARHFHPSVYHPRWLNEAQELSRRLGQDSMAGMRAIIEEVKRRGPAADFQDFAQALSQKLRRCERLIRMRARILEGNLQRAVGASCCHYRPRRLPNICQQSSPLPQAAVG